MSGVAGIVLGVAGLLALITFLPPLADRLRVPFTVVLAGLGCALGVTVAYLGASEHLLPAGVLRDMFGQLRSMQLSSEALLWIFLPILLFETALSLDGRALIDDLGPVLTMAVIAVVVTMLFGGLAVWAISGLSIYACLLVAAIIATTDPSAVVAIFREVGAPRRLVGLVEGESLLNDAAAIALFTALLGIIVSPVGQVPDLSSLALDFGREFIGGALLGAVMGRLAALFVGRIDSGGPAEVTLSVALAYLAYGFAELYLHASGVVAVVLAGLVFGSLGRTRIAGRDLHAVRAIWQQLGFWGSSLVFVLTSTVAPSNLAETRPFDLVLLGVLILGALAARALCLFGLLPLLGLGRERWRISRPFGAVMLWGGLRGAVTLALALAAAENPRVPLEVQHLVAVLATGFVLFTLLVQATTLRAVLAWLRLDQLEPVERMLRQRAMTLTEGQILKRVSEAAITYGIDVEKADEAMALYRRRQDAVDLNAEFGEDLLRQQLVAAIATITYRETELYVEEQARNMIGRRSSAVLIRDAGRLLDALKEDGFQGYRVTARGQLRFRPLTRLAGLLHRRLGFERPLAVQLAARAETLIVRRHVLEDLVLFARTKIRALFGERVAETAERVLEQRLDNVDRAADAVRLQYPSWWQAVSGRYLSRVAVRLEIEAYEKMGEDRLISPQVLDNLSGDLRRRLAQFEAIPRLDLGLDTDRLIARVPILDELDPGAIRDLRRFLQPRLALPGERIVRQGERGDAMFFIGSGAVEVQVGDERIRLGSGEFFGEMALILHQPRQADVLALGYCQLLLLSRDAFDRFLQRHPAMMARVRRTAEERLHATPLDVEEAV